MFNKDETERNYLVLIDSCIWRLFYTPWESVAINTIYEKIFIFQIYYVGNN